MKPKIGTITILSISLLLLLFQSCGSQSTTTRTAKVTGTTTIEAQSGGDKAIIENVKFTNGDITVDLLGEDNPGKSFVGIAFNIQDDETYEAIYLRPFNFKSEEKIRREHSIQYVSHPAQTWKKLREDQEGKFEAEFFNPPAPDDWFTISINVTDNKVIVKDSRSDKVILEVPRLAQPVSDKIAYWVGHNSKGSFRNMSIINN